LGYVATLSGAAESPPNGSLGVGKATIILDFALFTMRLKVEFNNLDGEVVAAHIHGNTTTPGAGVAPSMTTEPSLSAFPAGVDSGLYDQTLDLTSPSSYNPAFIQASGGTISLASNALFAGLAGGNAYFSIQTSAYPGGEVRGFFARTPPADFNFDGIVDEHDLPVWAGSFGTDHHGDATGDGQSDGFDFLAWMQQWGSSAAPPGHHHGSRPVPEPPLAGLMLVSIMALAAAARRSDRASQSLIQPGNTIIRSRYRSRIHRFPGNLVASPASIRHDSDRRVVVSRIGSNVRALLLARGAYHSAAAMWTIQPQHGGGVAS
jgi:hypothetical protein